jgi:hypothetical protein
MEVSKMKRYVMILILVGVLALPSVVSAQGEVLFGCTSDNESMLYMLDPSTGDATLVGDMGMTWCTGLAIDSNGNLFAVGWTNFGDNDWDPALYAVNPATGAATLIGRSGHAFDGAVTDLSFRSDDVLFGYLTGAEAHGLGTLNTATGAVTEIGQTVLVRVGGNGIAFHPEDFLFHSGGDELNILNQATGAASWIADLTFPDVYCPRMLEHGGPRLNALDFTSGGLLYGSLNCGWGGSEAVNYLATVDSEGDVTAIGRTVDRLDGIVFVPLPPPPEPEFVPEWGSIALFGSGLMGLAGYASLRWRKR